MAFVSRNILKVYVQMFGSNVEQGVCRFSVTASATNLADKSTASKGSQQTSTAKPPTPPPSPPNSKGDTYQAQDFFQYNVMSFYDIESDMRKHRLKQPTPGVPSN